MVRKSNHELNRESNRELSESLHPLQETIHLFFLLEKDGHVVLNHSFVYSCSQNKNVFHFFWEIMDTL